jgi:hypothetical protein
MDILSANKSMAGGGGGVIIHVIDTGVNPVGILAKRLEVVRYADTQGDTRALSGGKLKAYNLID